MRFAQTVRWVGVALMVLACVVAVTACGSSSGGSGGSSSTAGSGSGSGSSGSSTASKSPIKISTIVPLSGSGQEAAPQLSGAVKLGAQWINAHGGIDGHPIQVQVCDEQNNPNMDVTCARAAIANHSVACVGCYSVFSKIYPVLATAKIPAIGGNVFSQTDATSPIAFPVDSGPLITAGAAAIAGAKCDGPVSIVAEEIPAIDQVVALAQSATKAAGGTPGGVVPLPGQAQDFSAQAAKLAGSGSKCAVLGIGPPNTSVFVPALWQAGGTQRLVGLGGVLTTPLIKKLGSRTNGSLIGDSFPPLSAPEWAQYRAAINKWSSPTAQPWENTGAEQSWVGMVVLKEALEGDPTMTAPQLLAHLNKMSHVTTGGLTPPMNFTKPFPVPALKRIFNPSVVYEEVKNGAIVRLDDQFHDLTPVLTGGHYQ